MDLTPASAGPQAPRRRNRAAYVVLAVVVVAIGVVVYQALSSASLYFYNVDEAFDQRADLGEDRFRLQGLVTQRSETADGIDFRVQYEGVCTWVTHQGDPPDLFEVGIPVVLEGRWQGGSTVAKDETCDEARDGAGLVFASDRILVKHSEEYEAENEDRIDDARDGSSREPAEPGTPPSAPPGSSSAPRRRCSAPPPSPSGCAAAGPPCSTRAGATACSSSSAPPCPWSPCSEP